jgi:hypothetical protein
MDGGVCHWVSFLICGCAVLIIGEINKLKHCPSVSVTRFYSNFLGYTGTRTHNTLDELSF